MQSIELFMWWNINDKIRSGGKTTLIDFERLYFHDSLQIFWAKYLRYCWKDLLQAYRGSSESYSKGNIALAIIVAP